MFDEGGGLTRTQEQIDEDKKRWEKMKAIFSGSNKVPLKENERMFDGRKKKR